MTLYFNQYHLFLTVVFFVYLFANVKIIFWGMKIIASIIVFAILVFTPVKGLVQPAHQLGLMRDIFNFMSFFFSVKRIWGVLFFQCCFLVECVQCIK